LYDSFETVLFLCCLPDCSKHEDKASECRAIELASKAKIQQNERQKRHLEQEMSQLGIALQELQEASNRCSSSEKQVLRFRDQAKVSLHQYGIIIDRLRQVIQSLDVINSDVVFNLLNWDNVRYIALQSVLGIMTTLHAENLLERYNHSLLVKLEAIELPSIQRLSKELAW
jgi:hypothetical protein